MTIRLTKRQFELVDILEAAVMERLSFDSDTRNEAAYRIVKAKLELGYTKDDIKDAHWTGARKHNLKLIREKTAARIAQREMANG